MIGFKKGVVSDEIGDEACKTKESLPTGFDHPICTDISETFKSSVLIRWNPPKNSNGIILRYILYRFTIYQSVSFDLNYKPIEVRIKLKTKSIPGRLKSLGTWM